MKRTLRNPIDRIFGFIESLSPGDRFLFIGTIILFAAACLWLIASASAAFLTDTPERGGTLREGVVGTPRFINPVLAVTQADQDLTALVYASILKRGPEGTLVPEIAESVEVSEDGIVYTVVLKENVEFHDGTPLTVDDIIFTVSRIQDESLKSPLRASWEGVSTERLNAYEMQFVLPEPYAPFRENLTLGILPKHIWEQVRADEFPFSQYNSEPIGAGPYRIHEIVRNSSGIPETYVLRPHRQYANGIAKIERLVLSFYPTEAALVSALVDGAIDSAGGLTPEALAILREAGVAPTIHKVPLPRTFALFFNQNEKSLFRDAAVREAIDTLIDREALVADVLDGHGETINSPIPPGFGVPTASTTHDARAEEARAILEAGDWTFNEENGVWEKTADDEVQTLSFSIATANTPTFEATAKLIEAQLAALNIPVTIRQFEQSDLTQTVIRPRQYEALLFGTVVGRELDFYSFWHSSQRNDPGLNVALYTNLTTDALLSEARTTEVPEERIELFSEFSDELALETPAVFLYVPTYPYTTTKPLFNVSLTGIEHGSERFSTVSEWYVKKDAVWPIFTD